MLSSIKYIRDWDLVTDFISQTIVLFVINFHVNVWLLFIPDAIVTISPPRFCYWTLNVTGDCKNDMNYDFACTKLFSKNSSNNLIMSNYVERNISFACRIRVNSRPNYAFLLTRTAIGSINWVKWNNWPYQSWLNAIKIK